VESALGKGTSMIVNLPLSDVVTRVGCKPYENSRARRLVHLDEVRTLLILGTVLTVGALAVGLAAIVAWLRRRPS
jgi:hypothetical protein